jgi:small subunit ribosomal protein S1
MGKWSEVDDPVHPDEGYWQAVLQQGEWADGTAPRIVLPVDPALRLEATDEGDADWDDLEELYDAGTVVNLPIVGYNRGGLLVAYNEARGFIPASHLVGFPGYLGEEERRHELARRVGSEIAVRVIELDCDCHRLVFSERAASGEAARKQQLFGEIKAGDVREGYVTNVCDFGVFVDLGGIEGLMHISEISWGRVGHPGDVLTSGQSVHVYVMSVDPQQGRIALSLKRLTPDPWASVEERYKVGEIVEGRVTNVVNFGAFVCLEEGLEGLIHISQLAEGSFLHPRNVVREGEMVRARILSIDGAQRRLALSLREPGTGGNGKHVMYEDAEGYPHGA